MIGATSVSSTPATSSFNMQDFLKVLLTELTYQDPMKPMDNEQFMAQMAQFTALEQTQELNTKITQLISVQSSLASVGMLGRTVDATADSGQITGTVTGVNLKGDLPVISIKTTSGDTVDNIALSSVVAVR